MRFFLALLFVIYSSIAFCQFHNGNSAFSFKYKPGFLAAHRGTMAHIPQKNTSGFEVSFCRRINENKPWGASFRFPLIGITGYYSNLGNDLILGKGFGAYSFIEFPFVDTKRFLVSCKLASGLGIVTKIYDPITNPKNSAMGSHLNALICFGMDARIHLNKQFSVHLSADLTHMSNAASKVPNLGINMPTLGIGLDYSIASPKYKMRFQTPSLFTSWQFSIIGVLSAKQQYPTGGKTYPIFALQNTLFKKFKPKVGMEVSLDLISKQNLFDYRDYIPKTQWSIFQIGGYVGYCLPLDKFRFCLGIGRYIKDRYDADDEWYHRVGFKYQFDNGLVINSILKSHWAKADYYELGFGYTFGKKRLKPQFKTIELYF